MSLPRCYRVIVRGNLVFAVEPLFGDPPELVATTPLEVSTLLARNYQAQGCLDGHYHVPDADMARQIASLSFDFVAKLIERSAASLNAAAIGEHGWTNPFMGPGRMPA